MSVEGENMKLNCDQEVVARYLMKLLCLSYFDNVEKADVWMLLQRYSAGLMQEVLSKEQIKTVHEQHLPSEDIWGYLLHRSEKDKKEIPAGHGTPVVCYRCNLPGHIARGCKFFRCFRCNEAGHTISGCRKRKPRNPSRRDSSDSGTTQSERSHHREVGVRDVAPINDNIIHTPVFDDSSEAMTSNRVSCPSVPDDLSDLSDAEPDVEEETAQDFLEGQSECGSCVSGLNLALDRDCDSEVSEGGEHGCDDTDEHNTEHVEEGNFILTKFSEDDEDRPCWTYLSDETGVDCTDMALHDFIDYLESDANILDDQAKCDILCAIREDQDDMKMGTQNKYWFMYQ